MTALPRHHLTVDEFVVWSGKTPGRFELLHGIVYAMAPERAVHARVKFRVQKALEAAIGVGRVDCHMLPDGMTVRPPGVSSFEPDALVHCGARLGPDETVVPNPVIVVEVGSPSTRNWDESYKFAGYFQLPSVQHYLIIDPSAMPVIHHAGQSDGTILTRLVSSGTIAITPPGIAISVDGLLD